MMSTRHERDMEYTEIEHAVLANYLSRLRDNPQAGTRIWRNEGGQAIGSYFNASLTSAFQAVRALIDGRVLGYEGLTRTYPDGAHGESVLKILDLAASDNESIELDRLCRMVHAINFFRQASSHQSLLLLSVHARLMTAVEGNHGAAFARILQSLELPQAQILLQLPQVAPSQYWLLNYVAQNYRRNGFQVAVSAASVVQALGVLDQVQADMIRVDARGLSEGGSIAELLGLAKTRAMRILFYAVDSRGALAGLTATMADRPDIFVQGLAWEAPSPALQVDGGNLPVTAG